MSDVELSTKLLADMAGWQVMKEARGMVATGRVLSASWEPPLLKGSVQSGSTTLRSGLVIKNMSDVENICPCRDSRQRGIICAHSVALGLHLIEPPSKPATDRASTPKPEAKPQRPAKALRRAEPGQAGEPLEIWVILPPNLVDAASRGKLMICLEGKWRRGRVPLNALPLDTPFALSRQDEALLSAVEKLNGGDTPAMALLDSAQFTSLLPELAGHPGLTVGRSQPVEVSAEPIKPKVEARLEANGEIVLRLKTAAPKGLMRGPRGSWCFVDSTLRPFGLPSGYESLADAPVRLARPQVPMFLSQAWPALSAAAEVEANFALEDFMLETARPTFKLHLAGGLSVLEARLECYYGGQAASALPAGAFWLPDPSHPRLYRTRDVGAEQQAMGRLLGAGFSGPDGKGLFQLRGQNPVLNFFARHYPKLRKEWETTLEERLERSTRENLEHLEPALQVTPSGENWFDFDISYNTQGGQRFSQADIQRLLLSGQSHTRLANGKIALMDPEALDDFQEVLLDCAPRQVAGSYRMDNAQAGFLQASLERNGWNAQAPSAWSRRAAVQRGEATVEPPPLGHLDKVLRPYQKQGTGWLHFLRVNGFGGILADEMGLGKTVQVLAHLWSLRASSDASKRPSAPMLVVCPSSLVFNWAAEAARFTPELKVMTVQGPDRQEAFGKLGEHDLVITSYALLRRDLEHYQKAEFDTVVLDEAQHIKNRQTQNAQAVKAVPSRHRVVLTGTPLENSVLDLWSIYDFLMPGYLGTAKDFHERYEVPITREKSAAVQERLSRRVRPFLLRRLKREVAADLPEKIEQVSYCELTSEQRALYEQVLEASRSEILKAGEGNGLARSRMLVLTALLRLRQICCDPRLLKLEQASGTGDGGGEGGLKGSEVGASQRPKSEVSGKVELFGELLEEVLDGGHRVLVFSQFTSMLQLLREQLQTEEIECCYLDGATPDRAAVVNRFQKDATVPVFLISLKAGGVGLNLTGADTVIHFDPWWNPAVEAQATDRAHRIGQQKVVTSYKLITRGTVEEKILHLQTRKRALLQGMLGDEGQFARTLQWEEIRELLE